jgi:predicted nucleotidyltransferase
MKEHNIPVWRLYLYGSYAKDTYHEYSDIDLSVIFFAFSMFYAAFLSQ